jgi:hypothetical protein
MCASCLSDLSTDKNKFHLRLSLIRPALVIVSCLFLWSLFFFFGRSLLLLPDEFHDGTVWTAPSVFASDEDEN